MRVISQYRGYEGITARKEISEVLAGGERRVVQRGLRAVPFIHGDTSEYERITALAQWPTMRGLTEGENPVWRLSAFDSYRAQEINEWTDEEREIVENGLRTGPGNGIDYIIVESPKAPVPWPAYPKLTVQGRRTIDLVAAKIVETVKELELDREAVLLYERENEDRPEVIQALEAVEVETPVEETVAA